MAWKIVTDRRAGITNMMPLSILNGDKIKIEMDILFTLNVPYFKLTFIRTLLTPYVM